ncbi:MAG: nitroreductase family protein, partial [Turicibacter sp.]
MSIINNRVSVRKFSDQEVADQLMLEVAKAGLVAPSSKNKQPWQIVILNKRDILDQFCEFHPNWTIMKNANKAIVVCGDLESDERETHALMACSAATQ